jgi:hypothetical protein
VVKCTGTIFLGFLCYKDQLRWGAQDSRVIQKRFYFFLNIAALVCYTCATFIPEISRVGYYMTITQVLFIPALFRDWKSSRFKTLCMVGVTVAFLLYFVTFLQEAYETHIRLLPYRSWIFQ